jgi:hypothetical protein
MSPLLRRGFALFLLLLAASLLHPVDTTAQNLPGWAEPSEQRDSRFDRSSETPRASHNQGEASLDQSPDFETNPFQKPVDRPVASQGVESCSECGPNETCCTAGNSSNLVCKKNGCGGGQTPVPLPPFATALLSLIGLSYGAWTLRNES